MIYLFSSSFVVDFVVFAAVVVVCCCLLLLFIWLGPMAAAAVRVKRSGRDVERNREEREDKGVER